MLALLACFVLFTANAAVYGASRTFTVDYDQDVFLKDGQPFRYVSGSIHYYNVPYQLWEDRLTSMRLSGVNMLQTYVEWRAHEPKNGTYDFELQNDIVQYLKTAQKVGLLVNLRLGPYIDSEREMGGLPWWLLRTPMKLRTNDGEFLKYSDRWYAVLLPKIKPLLYENGGPIVLVQIENEYGLYSACDFEYTEHQLNIAKKYLGEDVVYYTTDPPQDDVLKCGRIEGCFLTSDFGTTWKPEDAVAGIRRHQRKGPLVNSEFYMGWFDQWGTPHHTVDTATIIANMETQLKLNFSTNIYMFHGGTHWYFDAAGELSGKTFSSVLTSYDFDSPLNEAGDPTPKYFAIKSLLKKYLPDVPDKDPVVKPKMSVAPFALGKIIDLAHMLVAFEQNNHYINSTTVKTMEELDFDYGLVAYSTVIDFRPSNPAVINLAGLRDRGYVYVDGELHGIVSRSDNIYDVAVPLRNGSNVVIVVENQGRVCYGDGIYDRKGLLSDVKIGKHTLGPWKIFQIPRKKSDLEETSTPFSMNLLSDPQAAKGLAMYGAFFKVNGPIYDTFLRLEGLTKGYVWLNGNSLGRYWPAQGPQQTLYAPAIFFTGDVEELVVVEQDKATGVPTAEFVKDHVINGDVPN